MTAPVAGAPESPARITGRTLRDALRTLRANFAVLFWTYVFYQAIAFAVLVPLLTLLARLLLKGGGGAMADAEIATFLLASPLGITALVLVSAIAIGITALEIACLMTLGLAADRGTKLRVRDAFAHGAARAQRILRITANLVLRLIVIAIPFVAAMGGTYWLLLTKHDINYYLSAHPPQFWAAVSIGGVLAIALAVVLLRRATSWFLVLPIVVFEPVLPFRAFGESAKRMEGRHRAATAALIAWAAGYAVIAVPVNAAIRALGRAMAPQLAGSLASLLFFAALFLVAATAIALVVGAIAASMFALIIERFYVDAGLPADVALPRPFANELELERRRIRITWPAIVGALASAVVVMAIVAHVFMKASWTDHEVKVFAHRGASIEAPENSLAAFRKAGQEHADFVELDVQESSDGVVLVNHDVDLMKLARSPLKIWQTPAAELRQVDIGSSTGPQFADQRVPTLVEALDACRGVTEVDIELKDYGHDQMLEERVAAIVDSMQMAPNIVTMSLSPKMVAKMKQIRPSWTSGTLIAKAIGNPKDLPGDFLAVQKSLATRRFIRQVHATGRPVYVWTVDDPQVMLRLVGLGVDGIITNEPGIAREALANYRAMTESERLLLFIMTQLGAKEEVLPPESELRP